MRKWKRAQSKRLRRKATKTQRFSTAGEAEAVKVSAAGGAEEAQVSAVGEAQEVEEVEEVEVFAIGEAHEVEVAVVAEAAEAERATPDEAERERPQKWSRFSRGPARRAKELASEIFAKVEWWKARKLRRILYAAPLPELKGTALSACVWLRLRGGGDEAAEVDAAAEADAAAENDERPAELLEALSAEGETAAEAEAAAASQERLSRHLGRRSRLRARAQLLLRRRQQSRRRRSRPWQILSWNLASRSQRRRGLSNWLQGCWRRLRLKGRVGR